MWNRTAKPKDQRAALAEQLDQLTDRRTQLSDQLATVEAAWSEALAAGTDTREHTSRRRDLLAEIADTDGEITRVQGWLGEVDAQLAREQAEANHGQLIASFEQTHRQLAALADEYAAATEAAIAATVHAARDLVDRRRTMGQLHEQLQATATAIGQSQFVLTGVTDGPVVAALPTAPPAVMEARRLVAHRVFDAAARQNERLVAEQLGAAAGEELRVGRL